jgi:hypothetical protein
MAKIHTESVVITFSKLVKESDSGDTITTADIVSALAQVAEELAGAGIVVEVEAFKGKVKYIAVALGCLGRGSCLAVGPPAETACDGSSDGAVLIAGERLRQRRRERLRRR